MPFNAGDRVKLTIPPSENGQLCADAHTLGVVIKVHAGNSHTPEDMLEVLFDSGRRQLLYAWRFTRVS